MPRRRDRIRILPINPDVRTPIDSRRDDRLSIDSGVIEAGPVAIETDPSPTTRDHIVIDPDVLAAGPFSIDDMTSPRIDVRRPTLPTFGSSTTFKNHIKKFEKLQSDQPILLFPVRLETRFSPAKNPTKLKLRIFPDQIMIEQHAEKLTFQEYEVGKNYNAQIKNAEEATKQQSWQWLVSKIGVNRAAYVAKKSAKNIEDENLREETDSPFAEAPLLPERWVVIGKKGDEHVIEKVSSPVARGLKFSPDIQNLDESMTDLSADPSISWMFDFSEAVTKGMALEIDLPESARDGIDELMVLGIKEKDLKDSTKDLDLKTTPQYVNDLFKSHLYTSGAGFVPQGMPTNNTEEVETTWSAFQPDSEAIRRREFGEKRSAIELEDASIEGGLSAPLEAPETLKEQDKNYKLIEKALGMKYSAFSKYEHRDAFESRSMSAMNSLIWGVSLGEYLGSMLRHRNEDVIGEDSREWVQDWFVDHVKAGASIPSVRVGDAPYGILPVQSVADFFPTNKNKKKMLEVMLKFKEHWDSAEDDLLQLAENIQGFEDPGVRLLELLSMQPNPTEFSISEIETNRGILKFWYGLLKLALTDNDIAIHAKNLAENGDEAFARFHDLLTDPSNYVTISTQAGIWDGFLEFTRRELKSGGVSDSIKESMRYTIKYAAQMAKLLEDHEERGEAIRSIVGSDLDFFKSTIDADVDDPNIAYSRYKTERKDYEAENLIVVPQENPEDEVLPKAYLDYLVGYAEAKREGSNSYGTRPFSTGSRTPLLYQLISTSISRTASDYAGDATKKTNQLDSLIDSIKLISEYSEKQLKLLLEQSLGLSGWRLDAWFTSLASQRLNSLRSRSTTRNGLQVGAFGWVENLKPQILDSGSTKQSQGYVHTPSLNHAKTAAILKAGWTAYKEEDFDSAMAVDLSSDRVRKAKWIFDAVKQGQDLGDVLGYYFERTLHDNKKDHWVYPIRKAVLEITQAEEDPQSPVVDGIELVEIWNQSAGRSLLETKAAAYFQTDFDFNFSEIEEDLNYLDSLQDALADSAIADSVHSLVQGNAVKAGSSIKAISSGEAAPPSLDVVETMRRGATLTHRVMMLWPTEKTDNSWLKTVEQLEKSPRAKLAGDVELMISNLLGSMENVEFKVAFEHKEDSSVVDERRFKLSELNSDETSKYSIGALDALYLIESGKNYQGLSLEHWIVTYLEQTKASDYEDYKVVFVWDDDEALNRKTIQWLQSWKDCLNQGRVLNAKDFTFSDTEDNHQVDVQGLFERMEVFVGEYEDFLDELQIFLSSPEEGNSPFDTGSIHARIIEFLIRCGRFNIPHSIPSNLEFSENAEESFAFLVSAFDILSKRLSLIDKDKMSLELSAEEFIKESKKIVKDLLGEDTYVGASIVPAEIAEIKSSFAYSSERLKEAPFQCEDWLEKLQYVRPNLRILNETNLVHELSDREGGGFSFSVGQWPHVEGEAWSALTVPTGEKKGRTSFLVALPEGVSMEDVVSTESSYTGLFIDEIIERIPEEKEDSGVALHFDSPNTEAPQTMLLAVTPEGASWDFSLMLSTIRETFQWAKLRAVDGELITKFDHHLPAVFPDKNLK